MCVWKRTATMPTIDTIMQELFEHEAKANDLLGQETPKDCSREDQQTIDANNVVIQRYLSANKALLAVIVAISHDADDDVGGKLHTHKHTA